MVSLCSISSVLCILVRRYVILNVRTTPICSDPGKALGWPAAPRWFCLFLLSCLLHWGPLGPSLARSLLGVLFQFLVLGGPVATGPLPSGPCSGNSGPCSDNNDNTPFFLPANCRTTPEPLQLPIWIRPCLAMLHITGKNHTLR